MSAAEPRPRSARALAARVALVGGLAALVLALVWSWPRARAASDAPPLDLVLVDASASATELRPAWRAEVERELARVRAEAVAAGRELALVALDAGATLERAPDAASGFDARTALEGLPRGGRAAEGSALAAALDLAERVRAERGAPGGRAIVIGDASYTGPDPAPRLARLAALGFACERRALSPPSAGRVALGELRLPRALHAGAALAARVTIHAPLGAFVRIAARARWAEGAVERELATEAPAGAPVDPDGFAAWSATIDFGVTGPGLVDIALAARAASTRAEVARPRAPAAPSAAESKRFARVFVGDAPSVLVAGSDAVALDALATALADARGGAPLAVERVVVGADARGAIAERLGVVDALVTLDLAPTALPELELAAFVRGGGGWLALLGPDARAAFAGDRGAFELLPLVPREGAPPRDVVFVVDGSGSMAGDAQTALLGAVTDVLGVLGAEERPSSAGSRASSGRRSRARPARRPTNARRSRGGSSPSTHPADRPACSPRSSAGSPSAPARVKRSCSCSATARSRRRTAPRRARVRSRRAPRARERASCPSRSAPRRTSRCSARSRRPASPCCAPGSSTVPRASGWRGFSRASSARGARRPADRTRSSRSRARATPMPRRCSRRRPRSRPRPGPA
ncbi:MAG: hypothetical protein IPJ77_15585 [Planctomycetes bacterium]|nr:hypothetical protein [Planctomycetota bacterium]